MRFSSPAKIVLSCRVYRSTCDVSHGPCAVRIRSSTTRINSLGGDSHHADSLSSISNCVTDSASRSNVDQSLPTSMELFQERTQGGGHGVIPPMAA